MSDRQYTVQARGDNESRELHLRQTEDSNYELKIWWGRGDKYLATMKFNAVDLDLLRSYLNELLVP